jgi:hypothetical protein
LAALRKLLKPRLKHLPLLLHLPLLPLNRLLPLLRLLLLIRLLRLLLLLLHLLPRRKNKLLNKEFIEKETETTLSLFFCARLQVMSKIPPSISGRIDFLLVFS